MDCQDRKVIYFTPGKMGPYHFARFTKLAQIYHDLLVVNILWDDARRWQFTPGVLTDKIAVIENTADIKWKNRRVIEILEQQNPEVIVLAGYNDPTQMTAAKWARKNKVPRILHADSWYGDHPRYWLKELIKKFYFVKPNFNAAFVPGILGFKYINSLGIPKKAIWRGLYVVDNDYFFRASAAARQECESWRRKLGLPQNYFLTVTRFIAKKNLPGLIRAFKKYRDSGGTWDLVIVGSGPEEIQIRDLANSILTQGLSFVGWQQSQELPVYYGLAKCFILPSISEPWGLVVNEAMACGLPVLVSRNCGCFPELCHRGINGFDFDPLDADELACLMLRISNGTLDLESMGAASLSIIANYSLETWALALQDCIETTISRFGAPVL